jgi:hypothetical protein
MYSDTVPRERAALRLANALEMNIRHVYTVDHDTDYRRVACLASTEWSAAGDNKPAQGYPQTVNKAYQKVWNI